MLSEQEAKQLRLTPDKDFIVTNANSLKDELLAAFSNSPAEAILLDLSKTSLMDSIGLKLVIGLYQSCKAAGKKLEINVQSPQISKLFNICRLNEFVTIHS